MDDRDIDREIPDIEAMRAQEQKPDFGAELYDWAESIVVALTLVVIIFTFVFRQVGVEGSSMYETLHNGDRVIISHLFYDTPAAGDIVVLKKDSFLERPIVKRVIAVGGQTIDINFDTHEVFVDGEVLYEPYIYEAVSRQNTGNMSFPAVVPEGNIFVMGDNRNHSSDSRDLNLGMVDARYVLGRVLFRIYPFNAIGAV